MAMIRMDPVEVRVRTHWLTGQPREVRWGDQQLAVTAISAVREETAAYPVEVGPRTTFVVTTSDARLVLAFRHRGRRWTLVGIDPDLARAA